ncbi:MAG: putative sulfate exporter family transporter [Gammaproteobacteria bacterium]|jgi:uncharacterized integral membrane protein (TIGR00698 family)
MTAVLRRALPGLALCAGIALLARFAASRFHVPALLLALAGGLLISPWSRRAALNGGIDLAGNQLLKLAVILLGSRITLEQLTALGWQPVAIIALAVPATLAFGVVTGRLMGVTRCQSLLSAGAVAICGGSAAMALAAVLPRNERAERQLVYTIICVTTLSSIAMVAYPLLAHWLGMGPRSAGIFLGGTIHNVPQAVAAGYVISHQAGDMATLTKLLRVTTLLPAVIGVAWLCDRQTTSEARSHAGLPLFLIGFFGVVVINSLGWLPGSIVTTLSGAAEWALIVALTALSARTTFSGMIAEGWRPLAVIVGDTVFLAGLVLAGLWIA